MIGRRAAPALALAILNFGCTLGPKRFLDVTNPAPLVRARAAGMGAGMPETVVVPRLIGRLNDRDPVVRLTAHEELRRATGQDFGFVPWGEPAARAQAVARWRAWWATRQAGLAKNREMP